MVAALQGVFGEFDEWIFLIADRLQFYNRASRVAEGASLQRLLLDMGSENKFSEQRRRWLEKIKAYRDSAAFKDLLPLRNKLATFRSYAVEGEAQ